MGIVGKNGAGKTTTVKLLTGEVAIRQGDAWIDGVSLKHKLFANIGYCPQVDSFLEDLTCFQLIEILGLIRGIPSKKIPLICSSLATQLRLDKFLLKRGSILSEGNRRKLCTAMALIGAPTVIYLDEPTTGMDVPSKRSLWSLIQKYRQNGVSFIITTHSMKECEATCTRLIILEDGQMRAIGTCDGLKQKYAKNSYLVVGLDRSVIGNNQNILELKKFLESQIRNLKVK